MNTVYCIFQLRIFILLYELSPGLTPWSMRIYYDSLSEDMMQL